MKRKKISRRLIYILEKAHSLLYIEREDIKIQQREDYNQQQGDQKQESDSQEESETRIPTLNDIAFEYDNDHIILNEFLQLRNIATYLNLTSVHVAGYVLRDTIAEYFNNGIEIKVSGTVRTYKIDPYTFLTKSEEDAIDFMEWYYKN